MGRILMKYWTKGLMLFILAFRIISYLHPIMAVKAMNAGIHVLTEKPIPVSLQDADKMIAVQKETEVKLGVIFQTHYTNSVETLKKMYCNGVFGKVTFARSLLTWHRSQDYYEKSDWKGSWDKEGGVSFIIIVTSSFM